MNGESSSKRLLVFLRDMFILSFINMLVVYIICKIIGSYNARSYGNFMVLIGTLYVMFGFGSMGLVSFDEKYIGNLCPKGKWLYADNKANKFEKNLPYILRGVIVGGITVLIGILLRGH